MVNPSSRRAAGRAGIGAGECRASPSRASLTSHAASCALFRNASPRVAAAPRWWRNLFRNTQNTRNSPRVSNRALGKSHDLISHRNLSAPLVRKLCCVRSFYDRRKNKRGSVHAAYILASLLSWPF